MCNEAYRLTQIDKLIRGFSDTGLPLRFPEGIPNAAPLESIRITDRVEIVRTAASGEGAEMVTRRWSWPAPSGKPVYNFRSDGRAITAAQRCLIPVDGFFEFTAPPEGSPPKTLKSKWAFTLTGNDWFCIAGIWRADPKVGEAWSMLTCEPGEDVAPYHSRQMVVLGPDDYARWLDPAVPASDLCRPLPAGSLTVERVR